MKLYYQQNCTLGSHYLLSPILSQPLISEEFSMPCQACFWFRSLGVDGGPWLCVCAACFNISICSNQKHFAKLATLLDVFFCWLGPLSFISWILDDSLPQLHCRKESWLGFGGVAAISKGCVTKSWLLCWVCWVDCCSDARPGFLPNVISMGCCIGMRPAPCSESYLDVTITSWISDILVSLIRHLSVNLKSSCLWNRMILFGGTACIHVWILGCSSASTDLVSERLPA